MDGRFVESSFVPESHHDERSTKVSSMQCWTVLYIEDRVLLKFPIILFCALGSFFHYFLLIDLADRMPSDLMSTTV